MHKRLLLLGLALLLALTGSGLVLAHVSAADERALAGQAAVTVLVVQQTVPEGTTGADALRDDLVALRQLPRAAVPDTALDSVDAVADLVTSTALHPGEVLLPARFRSPDVSGALPIQEGRMAVSVELTDPGRVAGFVLPGSEVAVFGTVEQPGGTVRQEETRLLLPRVRVLASGPTALRVPGAAVTSDEQDDRPTPVETPVTTSVLTLSVTQQQAQKLVHAAQTGRLYFGLLTSSSRTATAPRGTTTSTLFE